MLGRRGLHCRRGICIGAGLVRHRAAGAELDGRGHWWGGVVRRLAGRFGGGRGGIFRFFLRARLGFLHRQQALTVGDRDLVVVGMDFAEGQEAVPPAAIFNEGGLERGLYADDLGEIDVAFKLLLGGGLDIKVVEPLAVQNHHTGFLRVCGVDKHALRHCGRGSGAPAKLCPLGADGGV